MQRFGLWDRDEDMVVKEMVCSWLRNQRQSSFIKMKDLKRKKRSFVSSVLFSLCCDDGIKHTLTSGAETPGIVSIQKGAQHSTTAHCKKLIQHHISEFGNSISAFHSPLLLQYMPGSVKMISVDRR